MSDDPETLANRFRDTLADYVNAERGMQAKLARDIGVAPTQVGQWLNQRGTPSHERTLQILAWLPASERAKVFKAERTK